MSVHLKIVIIIKLNDQENKLHYLSPDKLIKKNFHLKI